MDRDSLLEMVSKEMTIRQMAAVNGCSYTNIRYWLKKHGLSTPFGAFGHRGIYQCSCGETDPSKFYPRRKSACIKCHNSYTHNRQTKNKLWAISIMGGQCSTCGYNRCRRALVFHHIDPTVKDDLFGSKNGWSRSRIRKELNGCILVCGNCHAEIHDGVRVIPETLAIGPISENEA